MEPVLTLKPDVRKVCTLNILKVVGAAAIILVVVYYAATFVEWSAFTEALDISKGEFPSIWELAVNFTLAILVVAATTLLLSYASLSKKQYMFFSDRLEIYAGFIIFSIGKKVISLNNIVSVRIENDQTGNFLGTGVIILELTGTSESSLRIENISSPGQYISEIQRLLDENRARYTTQYQQNQRIGDALERL